MTAIQTELFSLKAESFDAPLSDWDWENQHQPVQERSIEDWRSIYIDRAREDRPKILGTIPQQSPKDPDPELLINKSDEFWESVPDLPGDIFELGTIPPQSLTDSDDELGTIPLQSLTETVPNRKLKHPLPSMYQDWHKNERYWKFKPYVNGKRKTYHLHKNYGEAIAIGRKILAGLNQAA